MRKLSRKGSKCEASYSGPYVIVENAGKGSYYVRRQGDSKVCKTRYNSTRLKAYHQRPEEGIRNVVGAKGAVSICRELVGWYFITC